MMLRLFLQAVAVAVTAASTAVFDSGVPTTAPIPGNYNGQLRPQIHFSPPQKFMNDPNGCFLDANGTWHLYYQYNPTDVVAGNQHWGHATSRDLYHWENQKIAIFPKSADERIFSGSAVIDANNTSGFFPGQTNGVVAIYTLNTATEQVQDIAYSVDGGYTFTKYSGNPVIADNSKQFRDPKVTWHGDHWVMVVSFAQEFVIGFYTSPDLKSWTHASNFSHQGLLGLQYECPNLVAMPMEGSDSPMYMLAISINPGAPQGGSIQQYFPGNFNGTHFSVIDGAARLADFGKDNYAGQFFYGVPGTQDAAFIGWASNWQYSQVVPTGSLEGWRSAMTLPRRIHMANITRIGYDMVSIPVDLSPLYISPALAQKPDLGNGSVEVHYAKIGSGAVYFHVTVSSLPTDGTGQGTLNFTFSSSKSREEVAGGFYFGGDTPFWLDRGKTKGFDNPFFTDKFSTNNPINPNGVFELEGVIDRSILEVFLDGGRRSATTTFFPKERLDELEISTAGLNPGVKVEVTIWGLKSAWAEMENSSGLAYGNVTSY